MTDTLRGVLPPVYQPLVGEVFDRARVRETRATCDACAMCDHGQGSPVAMEYFLPDAKCCTYFPNLPNYLVGAILSDSSPDIAEGQRRVRAWLRERSGTTPHYLARPRKLSLLMVGAAAGFGRARSLVCPYFDATNLEKSCTIWRHREAICMTYYCKYSGGQRGFDFWTALKSYLGHVQRTLVRAAAEAVDQSVIEPGFATNTLTLEDIEDQPPNPSDYARWWGGWVSREEEFYVRCWEWVKGIQPEVFVRKVDASAQGKPYVDDLRQTLDKLENKVLPRSLVKNARMREDHTGERVVITSYHRYDSFALDRDLYEVVGMFRATETLEENLARLKTEGIELAPDLLEVLFVAGVLVEPAPPIGDHEARRAADGRNEKEEPSTKPIKATEPEP